MDSTHATGYVIKMNKIRTKFNDVVREKGNKLYDGLGDLLTYEVDKPLKYATAITSLAGVIGCAAQTSQKEQVYEGLELAHDMGYVVAGEAFKARETKRLAKLKADVNNYTKSKIQGESKEVKELKEIDNEISNLENSVTDKSKKIAEEYKGLADDLTAATNIAILGKEKSPYSKPKFREESKKTRKRGLCEFNLYGGMLTQDRSFADNLANIFGKENEELYKQKRDGIDYLGMSFNINIPDTKFSIEAFYHMFPENQITQKGETDSGAKYNASIKTNLNQIGLGLNYDVFNNDVLGIKVGTYFSRASEKIKGDITFTDSGNTYDIDEKGDFAGIGLKARLEWGKRVKFILGADYTVNRLKEGEGPQSDATFGYMAGIGAEF